MGKTDKVVKRPLRAWIRRGFLGLLAVIISLSVAYCQIGTGDVWGEASGLEGQGGPAGPLHFDPNDSPVQGVLLVQMPYGQAVRVEQFSGQTADEVGGFTEGALAFGR